MTSRSVSVAFALAVGAGVALAGPQACGRSTRPTPIHAQPTATQPTVTAAAPTTTAPVGTVGRPDDAAGRFYDSWKTQDRAAASRYAAPAAITTLFARKWEPVYRFAGCRPAAAGHDICAYRFEGGGGEIDMNVTGDARGGFRVGSVEFGSV